MPYMMSELATTNEPQSFPHPLFPNPEKLLPELLQVDFNPIDREHIAAIVRHTITTIGSRDIFFGQPPLPPQRHQVSPFSHR